jgi:class III poly(R)-hydroxyalkanoic acid synthase PhaE subunit
MTDSAGDHSQAPAFLKAWDEYMTSCQALFERLGNPAAGGAAAPLAFFDSWNEFAKGLGLDMKPEQMFASFAPALGYTREYQETVQRMMALSQQFQRRYAEFVQQGADIGQRAMAAVQERAAGDPRLSSSPADLYDAWIDSAEKAYAQAAHGEAFARLLAELCNVLSAFKVERGKLLDAFARHMDIPSRAEVDTLHRQVRDLRIAARQAATAPKPHLKPESKPKPKPKPKPKAKAKAKAKGKATTRKHRGQAGK